MSAEQFPNRESMHDEQGVYVYEDDNVTVISQPTFKETLEAIEDQPPAGTTIVTPELVTLDDFEFEDFVRDETWRTDAVRLLRERFMDLKSASFETSNIIIAGMPTWASPDSKPRNSLATLVGGSTINTQHKVNPGIYEENLGVFEYPQESRKYHRFGATAIICSELLFTLNFDPTLKRDTKSLLVSAAWGVPSVNPDIVATHGSVDKYNQYTLTTAAQMATEDLPNLEKIYIADRPMDGNKPQIGRIKTR